MPDMKTKRHDQLLALFCVVVVGLALRVALGWNSVMNLPPSTDESISQLLADSISHGELYPLLFSGQPYQFPLEAYLMSVFSGMLPNDAFGARIQLFLLRLLTTVLLCTVAIQVFEKGKRLPTLALILVPSAYWLVYQAGYAMPQHSVFAFLSSLTFLLAIHLNRRVSPAYLLTVSIGILSGLSISNHLLALSVVAGVFLVVVFTGSRRLFFQRAPAFAGGLLIGLIPYLMALFTIDGAYDAIAGRLDSGVFFHRFFNVVIGYALPGAMGIFPPRFPDFSAHIEGWAPLRSLFVGGFLFVLFSSILIRLYKFYTHTKAAHWPRLQWPDMFLIVTLASITMMSMNSAGDSKEHRYLMPAVWVFPFLIGYIYVWGNSLLRLAISGFTVALLVVNLATGITVIKDYHNPENIQRYADVPELAPVMSWMQAQNIDHCYASFWQAYRFTYESSGNIFCSPVYNERFLDWPIPYKDEVNRQTRVAYFMSRTHQSRYTYIKFEKHMKAYGITYQRKQFGKYFAYYDFEYQPADGESLLPASEYNLSTNIDQAQAIALTDGNVSKAWEVKETQKAGQYIEGAFTLQQYVQRVDIVHPFLDPYPANSVRVLGRRGDTWFELSDPVEFQADLFAYYNNHPVLGEFLQTIRFDPQWLDGIRIELVSPKEGKDWTLSEVRIGVQENG
jgi:hypothetical protein